MTFYCRQTFIAIVKILLTWIEKKKILYWIEAT